jgi:hypothetical protein
MHPLSHSWWRHTYESHIYCKTLVTYNCCTRYYFHIKIDPIYEIYSETDPYVRGECNTLDALNNFIEAPANQKNNRKMDLLTQ